MFTAEKSGEMFLCQCKNTGNAPFCDGTHARLPGDAEAQKQRRRPPLAQTALPPWCPCRREPTIHELARDGLSKSVTTLAP